MKKTITFLMALLITASLFAQDNEYLFPKTIDVGGCGYENSQIATIKDSIVIDSVTSYKIFEAKRYLVGSNSDGDSAFAQRFSIAPGGTVQILGIAMRVVKERYSSTITHPLSAKLYKVTGKNTFEELHNIDFSTKDLSTSSRSITEFVFDTPITMSSDYAIALFVPNPYGYRSEKNVGIASTVFDVDSITGKAICAEGGMSYILNNGEWVTFRDLMSERISVIPGEENSKYDVDYHLYPIVKKEFTLDANNVDFGTEGGTRVLDISATVDWDVTYNAEWLTVTPSRDNTLAFTTQAMLDGAADTSVYVYIHPKGMPTDSILVTQGTAKYLNLERHSQAINPEGETAAVTVYSNAAWTVTSNQTWATVLTASGTNQDTMKIAIETNPTKEPRTARITVQMDSTKSEIITLSQEALPFLDLSINSKSVAAKASTFPVSIETNLNWAVTSDVAWLTPSETSGANTSSLIISVEENTPMVDRIGKIIITAGNFSDTVTVEQASGVGIEDALEEEIILFPNPVNTNFYIKGIKENCTLTLFNAQGRVLLQRTVSEEENISIEHFAKGVYFARITTPNGFVVKELIKK